MPVKVVIHLRSSPSDVVYKWTYCDIPSMIHSLMFDIQSAAHGGHESPLLDGVSCQVNSRHKHERSRMPNCDVWCRQKSLVSISNLLNPSVYSDAPWSAQPNEQSIIHGHEDASSGRETQYKGTSTYYTDNFISSRAHDDNVIHSCKITEVAYMSKQSVVESYDSLWSTMSVIATW